MIKINNNKGAMKGGSLVKLSLLDKTRKKYVLGHLGYFLTRNAEGACRDISSLYDVLMIPGLFTECLGKKGSRKKRTRS